MARRFLATASHDLRQPVQTLAFLKGIVRRTVTEPQALDAVSQPAQAIGVMSRLLNSLPNLRQLKSGGGKRKGRFVPRTTDSTGDACCARRVRIDPGGGEPRLDSRGLHAMGSRRPLGEAGGRLDPLAIPARLDSQAPDCGGGARHRAGSPRGQIGRRARR
jgi:hypothetical protein